MHYLNCVICKMYYGLYCKCHMIEFFNKVTLNQYFVTINFCASLNENSFASNFFRPNL